MSSNPIDCDFQTSGGTKLRFGSYWRWNGTDKYHEGGGDPPWFFRLEKIQDSAGGLHAIIFTQDGRTVGVNFGMFDSDQISEVTDPEELGLAMLAVL